MASSGTARGSGHLRDWANHARFGHHKNRVRIELEGRHYPRTACEWLPESLLLLRAANYLIENHPQSAERDNAVFLMEILAYQDYDEVRTFLRDEYGK